MNRELPAPDALALSKNSGAHQERAVAAVDAEATGWIHDMAIDHDHCPRRRRLQVGLQPAGTRWNGYSTATYDGAGEVREVRAYNASGVSVPGENFFYGYDAGWNMLKRTNNLTINTYTPNELNQAAGSYDSNGNRTSGADSYTYDVENQLIGIEEASSWKLEFVYDGRQRLRVIKDYEYSGGVYTLKGEVRLMYDGMNVIQERNGSGHPTVSYTRGLDLSGSLEGAGGIGGLLTRSSHATSSPYQQNSHAFYHADGNGNVTYLRRNDGASYAAYKYDPFGRTLSSAGGLASANRMRFSSKPWIQSSSGTDGLYYYGYRFYDPLTQRWMNRDPIGEQGGINLYGFVKNGPFYKIDPWGLCQCKSGEAKTTVKSQVVDIGKEPGDDEWIEIVDEVLDRYGKLPVKKPVDKAHKAMTGFVEMISSIGATFHIYMSVDIECCIGGSWKNAGSKTVAIEDGKEKAEYSHKSIKNKLSNPSDDIQRTLGQLKADAAAICSEIVNSGGTK